MVGGSIPDQWNRYRANRWTKPAWSSASKSPVGIFVGVKTRTPGKLTLLARKLRSSARKAIRILRQTVRSAVIRSRIRPKKRWWCFCTPTGTRATVSTSPAPCQTGLHTTIRIRLPTGAIRPGFWCQEFFGLTFYHARVQQGGHNAPGAESLRGAPKSPNNVTSAFFNTVHLLPKDLKFEHGSAKLASCPGRHLTWLRPGYHAFSSNCFRSKILTSCCLFVLFKAVVLNIFQVMYPLANVLFIKYRLTVVTSAMIGIGPLIIVLVCWDYEKNRAPLGAPMRRPI